MKVIVCGGRDYSDAHRLYAVLNEIHANRTITVLAHGCAPGADTLADQWAKANGVTIDPYPADWSKHGKAAGPIRNSKMLASVCPDLVIAFPGNRGTADMVGKAKSAGVPIHIVDEE